MDIEDPRGCGRLLLLTIARKSNRFKTLPLTTRQKIIIDLEAKCFNVSIDELGKTNTLLDDPDFLFKYSQIIARIAMHIDPESEIGPTDILEQIINQSTPKDFCSLPSRDLWCEKSRETRDEIQKRNQQKAPQKTSQLYVCNKCKKNQTIVTEVQLRSLDEGCNFKITCVHCQNQWIA
ncbi:MAG: hypothetical protein KAS12_04065 [Candidatus Aenigmarchaeota archaeon]|nr:hypothetical protein [Candidatus Aenigmarchaeota archaeon]